MSRHFQSNRFLIKTSYINNPRLSSNPKFSFPCQKVTSLGSKRKIEENNNKFLYFNHENNKEDFYSDPRSK